MRSLEEGIPGQKKVAKDGRPFGDWPGEGRYNNIATRPVHTYLLRVRAAPVSSPIVDGVDLAIRAWALNCFLVNRISLRVCRLSLVCSFAAFAEGICPESHVTFAVDSYAWAYPYRA